jgi:hypothetical protein
VFGTTPHHTHHIRVTTSARKIEKFASLFFSCIQETSNGFLSHVGLLFKHFSSTFSHPCDLGIREKCQFSDFCNHRSDVLKGCVFWLGLGTFPAPRSYNHCDVQDVARPPLLEMCSSFRTGEWARKRVGHSSNSCRTQDRMGGCSYSMPVVHIAPSGRTGKKIRSFARCPDDVHQCDAIGVLLGCNFVTSMTRVTNRPKSS